MLPTGFNTMLPADCKDKLPVAVDMVTTLPRTSSVFTAWADTLPATLKLPMFRLPEKSSVLTYKVPQRLFGVPKFLMFEALGMMSTLAITAPMPLGAKTRLPLVLSVRMVLLAMAMLLSTGPAAKIWSKFTFTLVKACSKGSPGGVVEMICCPPALNVAVIEPVAVVTGKAVPPGNPAILMVVASTTCSI